MSQPAGSRMENRPAAMPTRAVERASARRGGVVHLAACCVVAQVCLGGLHCRKEETLRGECPRGTLTVKEAGHVVENGRRVSVCGRVSSSQLAAPVFLLEEDGTTISVSIEPLVGVYAGRVTAPESRLGFDFYSPYAGRWVVADVVSVRGIGLCGVSLLPAEGVRWVRESGGLGKGVPPQSADFGSDGRKWPLEWLARVHACRVAGDWSAKGDCLAVVGAELLKPADFVEGEVYRLCGKWEVASGASERSSMVLDAGAWSAEVAVAARTVRFDGLAGYAEAEQGPFWGEQAPAVGDLVLVEAVQVDGVGLWAREVQRVSCQE